MSLSSRLFLALSIAPLLAAQTQFSTDVLALNPDGFWPLNGNANDASTHGNNGALMNGVSFSGSVDPLGAAVAPAAVFTSSQNQFVLMPAAGSSIFNFGSVHAFTAMAWIRTLGTPHMAIISKFDPSFTGWSLAAGGRNGGVFELLFVAAGTAVGGVQSTVPVNDGAWHLVAATYDGSGSVSGIQLYLDGVSVASTVQGAFGATSFLNAGPLTIGAEADSSDAFDGNVNDAAVFGAALTPAQNLQLAEDAVEFQGVLSQFVFGGGWYSAIYFTNTGAVAVSFPVKFIADSGNPLNITSIGGSGTTVTLAAGGATVIEAPNAGSLVEGYVTALLPVGVSGYGVFRQSVAGIPDQEAVVPLSAATGQFYSLLYDETNFVTAVAIVNPSNVTITVAITVVDINGKVLGTGSVMLPPLSKTEAVLKSIPGLSAMVGNRGTAQFSVTTGALTVLGLRFNGAAFTSIPVFAKAGI